jgi:hypothetical protein
MHIKTPEKYYFYTLTEYKSNNMIYLQLKRTFSDKNSLISFLADSVCTYGYNDSARWTCPYFNEINVTGNDYFISEVWSSYKDELGIIVPNIKTYKHLRPYYFETDNGKTVDVRNFKDEVYARVYAKQAKLIPEPHYTYKYKGRYQRPTSHTCLLFHTNSHFYRRLKQTHNEEYKDENIYVKFKPKAKDVEAKCKWYDDFWSKGESGWKTHKHRHQWEHKLYRKK